MSITKDDIINGLRSLGLASGDCVMVHSSLSSLGHVEGGAETVIEALLETVGDQGTVLMPAMSGDQPFRLDESPSGVGYITEVFRTRDDTTRSLHPTHSVSGRGPLVEELIEGHIDQPTALGPESPWGRLARRDDSYILLLGVDQDRNTLLHCAEEVVDAPYLNTIQRDYIDSEGKLQTKTLRKFPGPHRDFIGLDPLFEASGGMAVGTIGNAVCRLTPAKEMLQIATDALKADMAAVLCDNPRCRDCVQQRADIKRDELSREPFTPVARLDDVGFGPHDVDRAIWHIRAQGLSAVEIGPWILHVLRGDIAPSYLHNELMAEGMDVRVCHAPLPLTPQATNGDIQRAFDDIVAALSPLSPEYLKLPGYPLQAVDGGVFSHALELASSAASRANEHDLKLLIENEPGTICYSHADCDRFLEELGKPDTVYFSFNPAYFARAGEKPFLQTFRRSDFKRRMVELMITDGCAEPWPEYTLPGRGQGELKELMSILRCRSFDGLFTIAPMTPQTPERFDAYAEGFWKLLHTC
ncbi:MAG: AAC(3) family N-acetyltransferase [Armatimonadota bacterium]